VDVPEAADQPQNQPHDAVSTVSTTIQTKNPHSDAFHPLHTQNPNEASKSLNPKRRLFTPDHSEAENTPKLHFRLCPRPPPVPSASGATTTQIDFIHHLTSTSKERKFRICDCQSCVDHAIKLRPLTQAGNTTQSNESLRFVTLIGISGHRSSPEQRDELADRYRNNPQSAMDICSCTFCITQQLLDLTWRDARHHQYPADGQPIYKSP